MTSIRSDVSRVEVAREEERPMWHLARIPKPHFCPARHHSGKSEEEDD
jgi:hypothetical protein